MKYFFRTKSFVYCTGATRLLFLRRLVDDTLVPQTKNNLAFIQSYKPCLVRIIKVWLFTAHDAFITLWTVRKCPKSNTLESGSKQKLQMARTTSIMDLESTRKACCVISRVLQNWEIPVIDCTNVKKNSLVFSQVIWLC